MSTILDSLKKSSDQRNNNGGDSLDNFNFSNQSKSSSFSKIIVILIIALALAGAFWVYQNYFAGNMQESEPQEVIAEQANKKSLKNPTNENTKTQAGKNNSKIENLQLSQNTRKKDKPNSNAIKARIKKLKEQKEQQAMASREAKLSDLNRNNSSFVESNKKEDIYAKIKAQRSLINSNGNKKNENNEKATKSIRLAQQESNPKLNKADNTATKKTVPSQQHRLLYQLPFSIRKEIPELKLNIHVYDEVAENRIAIINGTRFAVGDMVTDQILLKDIVVNGIVLDYNGNEFFIPN